MLNQESLSFIQALMVSGLGMFIVLLELSVLAVSIKIFTYFVSLFHKEEAVKKQNADGMGTGEWKEDDLAVVMAVMNEEFNFSNEHYQIVAIREV